MIRFTQETKILGVNSFAVDSVRGDFILRRWFAGERLRIQKHMNNRTLHYFVIRFHKQYRFLGCFYIHFWKYFHFVNYLIICQKIFIQKDQESKDSPHFSRKVHPFVFIIIIIFILCYFFHQLILQIFASNFLNIIFILISFFLFLTILREFH